MIAKIFSTKVIYSCFFASLLCGGGYVAYDHYTAEREFQRGIEDFQKEWNSMSTAIQRYQQGGR